MIERRGRRVLVDDWNGIPAGALFPTRLHAWLYQTTGMSVGARWGGFRSWEKARRWLNQP